LKNSFHQNSSVDRINITQKKTPQPFGCGVSYGSLSLNHAPAPTAAKQQYEERQYAVILGHLQSVSRLIMNDVEKDK
jgi:hypothetical protein